MTGYLRRGRAPGCSRTAGATKCCFQAPPYGGVVLQRNRYARTVELVSTVEVAELLGLTRQRVDKLSRSDAFPEPVAALAIGRVWRRDDIVEWAKQTGRLPADFDG